MPITLVTPNFSTKFRGLNSQKNYFVNEIPNAQNAANSKNYLVDSNYGRSLIKNNQISFTGATLPATEISNEIIPLSKKVAAALFELKTNDVLLIGNNLEKSTEALKKTIGAVPKVIKRLLFIEDKELKSIVAISKNDRGSDELINLSGNKLKMIDNQKRELFIAKGDNVFIEDGDTVLTEGSPLKFSVAIEKGFADIRKNTLQIFDFSNYDEKEIDKLNLKHLQKINQPNTNPAKITKFSDIGGQDEAIAALKRKFYYPIKNPNFFKDFGANRSALMVGPPGNAKTLSAKALANELDIPFFDLNAQLLEGGLVGESAEKIHNYYEMLREHQPCIAFFDEVEATLGNRTGLHKYADDSVSMHLDEMSKLEKENAEVYILAATNKPEIMDKAATRSGRFGTKITFKNPDTVAKCKTIFGIHTANLDIKNLNSDEFAKKLLNTNVSGADIAGIASEAKLNSIVRQGIFEEMEAGTFEDKAGYKLKVIGEDFDKALDGFIENRKAVEDLEKESQKTRQEEIKNELIARQGAEKEIKAATTKPRGAEIGFRSERYKQLETQSA